MEFFGYQLGIEHLVFGVFVLMLVIQLFYFLFFFIRLTFFKQKTENERLPPVSVIVCARNEEKNLMDNLPRLFEQDYPDYEVVVVNDRSWDETKDVLHAFQQKYNNLHVINIPDSELNNLGKKLAITLGVKGASNEYLLLTDADCVPSSDQWIRTMAGSFTRKSLVLGYSPYQKQKGLLNKIIRFDTVQIGVQYLSFALAGLPYMGVGRNMSYRKELFFSVGGFKSHYHIASGDDDLFVNQVAKESAVDIVIDPKAQMVSTPKETFSEWWIQKRRHFTTSTHYRWVHKLFLGLFPLSLLFFLATFVGLLFTPLWPLACAGYGVRLLVQLLVLRKPMRVLGGKDLYLLTPIIEPLMLLLNPAIYFSNLVVKPTRWS